jgi:hypothetical protein
LFAETHPSKTALLLHFEQKNSLQVLQIYQPGTDFILIEEVQHAAEQL